jgi:hypothetical protein
MEINDYLKIANEYAVKHNKTDDFIVMGLYKLIQETDLKRVYAHSLLSQYGDNSFGLTTSQSSPLTHGVQTVTRIMTDPSGKNGTTSYSVDRDKNNNIRDVFFGHEHDHDLIRRFNDDLQNVESLFDLKDVYTFDEITRIKHLTLASLSTGLALELISQNNESFETGKYNAIQNSYRNQISLVEDVNYGKSQKFDFFSKDPLYELLHAKKEFPFTPDDFFKELNPTAQAKIIDISGFGHITFIEEVFQDLIDSDSPFITDSFVGSLFTMDSLRDVIISYYDYNELDDLKFEFSLMADRFLSNPTIEQLIEQDEKFANVDDMLMEVYAKHPEINYSIQDISIITDKEIANRKEVIDHQVDKFHMYESAREISDLGPSHNDRRDFLSKFKLYGSDILKEGEYRMRFISSNQFAADAVLSASFYFDEGIHNEILIDSVAINPQLSDIHITELLESVVDYAQKNKSIIMFTYDKDSPWGGIDKTRLINIVNAVVEQSIDNVPFLCNFGIEKDRYHYACNYLVNMDGMKYEELPKLFDKLKTFIDNNSDLDDLQLELKMDELIAKERNKLKSDNKASI